MEFYKNIGKNLFIFNLVSVFFLLLTIFAYSLIQYLAVPLYNLIFALFDNAFARDSLTAILNFFLIIPQFLDYAFLLFTIVFCLNLIYLSWQTKTGSLMSTVLFTLVGLPIWVYFMQLVNEFKLWALRFLSSVLVETVDTPFYNYIQSNSLIFSIFLFMICIAIRTIDWENVKILDKFGKRTDGSSSRDERTLQEILKQ